MLNRDRILLEMALPNPDALREQGRDLARDWKVRRGSFLAECGFACEVDYKNAAIADGRIMQHAQIGFRDLEKSRRAWAGIHEACDRETVQVDRYGICLDWSMGVERAQRGDAQRGTGLILDTIEEFVALTAPAPVAPHFGDFVLGFPAAIENVKGALAAGATSIGNLGQYFTFRLHGHDDDLKATEATIVALHLIAAQDVPVLVHSNLDDGFAALFADMASSLGAVLLERHIVETLIGGTISHCWGHHFSDPVGRMAFHLALASVSEQPGTMIYGNTTSYRGGDGANYASLSSYLLTDIQGQMARPTGHAVNPVPVRENQRIPDIEEVIEAQLFAGRLRQHAATFRPLLDLGDAEERAARIVAGGQAFFQRVLSGLDAIGIDTNNPVEMLLALRRIGGRRLEQDFGAGPSERIRSPIVEETADMVATRLELVDPDDRKLLADWRPRVMVASSDVHEHGKLVVEQLLAECGVTVVDGGASMSPSDLALRAAREQVDAIALSTYNGVALDFFDKLVCELGGAIPILIGGRLNQISDGSNSSLPVDVTEILRDRGAHVCETVEAAVPALLRMRKGTP